MCVVPSPEILLQGMDCYLKFPSTQHSLHEAKHERGSPESYRSSLTHIAFLLYFVTDFVAVAHQSNY